MNDLLQTKVPHHRDCSGTNIIHDRDELYSTSFLTHAVLFNLEICREFSFISVMTHRWPTHVFCSSNELGAHRHTIAPVRAHQFEPANIKDFVAAGWLCLTSISH